MLRVKRWLPTIFRERLGICQSGFGREKGLRALDEYSALRTTTVRVDV